MKINVKNILICIGIIVVTFMVFDTTVKLLRINYIIHVAEEDSSIPLRDDEIYSDLSIVIKKYLRSIKNEEYDILKDMSLYKARLSMDEYLEIKNSLVTSDMFDVIFNNITVLDTGIYLCDLYTKSQDIVSPNLKIAIKLNKEEGYFRVLNIRKEVGGSKNVWE